MSNQLNANANRASSFTGILSSLARPQRREDPLEFVSLLVAPLQQPSYPPRQGLTRQLRGQPNRESKALSNFFVNTDYSGHGQGDGQAKGNWFVHYWAEVPFSLDNKSDKRILPDHRSAIACPATHEQCSAIRLIIVGLGPMWPYAQIFETIRLIKL